MKKNNIVKITSAILVVMLLATGCGKKIEVKNGSKVAVSVKGEKFTATEYYEKIKEDNISKLIDMIDHSFLDKDYKTTSEETEEINKQIDQIKSSYGSNEDTYKAVLSQYFGVKDENELREKLSLEYKRNKAIEDYVKDNLKDDEIKKYYNEKVFGEVKASHILIPVDVKDDATDEEKNKADEKAKKEAEKVIKELNDGKKFADLAKKYSKDESNASNGGDLGYFNLDEMVTEFSDAVKKLKVDEYTKEPVKTEFGYHIILKTGEKEKKKLKEVKDDIKEKLMKEKLNNDKTLYYHTLIAIREKKKISWNDDGLKKAYDNYMNDLIDKASQN